MKLIMKMNWTSAVLCIILSISGLQLTHSARQNPLKDPKICGRPECDLDSKKFTYTDAIRYKYDYNLHIRSEFSGTGDNTSDLYLKATVDLIFPKDCEGVLSLSSIELRETIPEEQTSTGFVDYYDYGNEETEDTNTNENSGVHPKSAIFAKELQKHELRFAFHDGVIGEVCPSIEEASWVLNLKKGILSSFQNSMLRFDVDVNTMETDVSGTCNVGYTLQGNKDAFVLIKKEKDIASCRNRHKTHSFLQTTPYTFREDKSIWPVLSSLSYCNLTIDHSIYKEISCFERHQLIPFSSNDTGAVTISHSKLTLNSEEPYNNGDFYVYQEENLIKKRSTLLFDHTPSAKPTHNEIRASRDLLKQMCSVGFPNIQREFIDVFTTFLQTTNQLDYKSLTQLLARSDSICTDNNGRKHVLESLPYIKSTASYKLMRDQIISNQIPKLMAHNWMTSLSFISRPDEETLETFYTIIEYSQKRIDPEYTLGATAVIHRFCRHHSDCASHEKVKKIINLLETEFWTLYQSYKNDRRTRDRLIVVLKGLGNIGVMSDDFIDKLKVIIRNEKASVEIRIHAVMAFRRSDCYKTREFFLEIYGDFSINTEIRIFSYLQSMRCPNYKSINIIKSILKNEEINQVGSFVWSHLKNLAKSSSPVRVEAQGLLVNDDLDDKFKMDIRKFSRNYEYSLFFDEYNVGTSTDANLVFGTDSYLPRIASFNFTADLFGESVNFFEITGRAQGFEQLVTSIFGPKGPLNRELFRKKFSFLNKFLGDDTDENDDSLDDILSFEALRKKRDTDDYNFEEDHITEQTTNIDKKQKEMNEMQKDIDKKEKDINDLGYKLNYNYNDPRATIGLRIFGNDLRYYSIDGMLEVLAAAKEFDPFHQAAKILSGEEITFTKSRVFLDASYNVPLSVGLPLSVNVFGASSVDIRLSGNLKRLAHPTGWHFDIEGKVKPSISVDVITSMQTDVFYAISGIKVKSNLYSSSAVETKLKVRGSDLVSWTFSLPQDKNEIFSARSEMIVMKDTEEIPQPGIEKRSSNTTCTWPVLDQAVGLKVCSHFSVPDLSNSNGANHPGLLLSGPLNISLILEKSDLSAKKFVFEYEWLQVANESKSSFIFHTPDSEVRRMLTANITSSPSAVNGSVIFLNGPHSYSLVGRYNGNPEYRRLDIFHDNNGKKNFNLNMEMPRYQDRNAFIYKPKFLMSVNGENITGLVGTVKINEKNGISQSDFELSFETKRLQSIIKGNLIQSEITTSTNTTINYRFQANKTEVIRFEGKLSNIGDKSKTEYKGDMNLKTSAYPKINFASNMTWLSLQGHTEGKLTYNNAPGFQDPNYLSMVRMIFVRADVDEMADRESLTRASVELKVPPAKVDFKVALKHVERKKNGTEHTLLTSFRYAPKKEVNAFVSAHFPRRNLFAMDGYMNISVPEFDSCTAKLKILENKQKDYLMDFSGTWFSGHSLTLKGIYKDKSTRLQNFHHLKFIAESPSFQPTSVNLIYRRNALTVYADVQAKYSKDPYRLTIEFSSKDEQKKRSHGAIKVKVKDKEYWILSNLLIEERKSLQIEIHLDRLRDIHLQIEGMSALKKKGISLELKWDANRDPTQRLALIAEYNNPDIKTYDANVMMTYPDRTFSCGFAAYTGGPNYNGSLRASWSSNDAMILVYDAGFVPGENFNNWIRADLTTPFEGWKRNRMRGGIYHSGNLILANSSLLWADNQNLAFLYKSDYEINEPLLSFDVRLGINSTIRDIPTVNARFKHSHDMKKFNSDVDFRYSGHNNTMNIYSVKSDWELTKNAVFKNVTGSVLMMSPFEGYRKGGLATKFSFSENRNIQGAASLNFEKREFTMALDGYVKKFTDNMLEVNITTPLEKFKTIKGRFGLSEKRKHAVAEVRAPKVALGAEILFSVISFSDFDIKLSLATPIDAFQRLALIAKVKTHTIDLRGGWNNVTLGFTGVWRMVNTTDFEYSYKVFTPLPKFEENGFIVKFIKRDIFNLELHGKLSSYKLGVKVNGNPKSKLLNQLGSSKLEFELLYDEDLQPPVPEPDYEYEDENEEINYNEFFTYFVDFELDTLVWPTVNGIVDIQEIRDFFIIVANIKLPQGVIDLKDRLYYPHMLNIKNVLNIQTPFPQVTDLKAIYEYDIEFKTKYLSNLHIFVKNASANSIEAGYFVNYTVGMSGPDEKIHDIVFSLTTPFKVLPRLDVTGFLQLEENVYKANVTTSTPNTHLTLAGSLETEENFLESSVGIQLDTTVIPHYGCRLYFKKDLSEIDNYINIELEIEDNRTEYRLQIESGWHLDPANYINARGKVQTNLLPLKLAETSILITKEPNPILNFVLGLVSQNGTRIEYGAKANKKKDVVNAEIWTPIKNFRNVSMHGTMTRSTAKPNEYQLNGHLYKNLIVYTLNGYVMFDENYPSRARLRVRPKTGGPDGIIEFSISKTQDNFGKNFEFSAIEDGKMCTITGGYSLRSKTNWDVSVLIQSTEPEISRINLNAQLKPEANGAIIGAVALDTPWKDLGIDRVRLGSNVIMVKPGGKIEGNYEIGLVNGRGSCNWEWILLQNMQLNLESYTEKYGSPPRIVQTSACYLNPNRSFQQMKAHGKLNVDSLWILEVNSTVAYLSMKDIQVGLVTQFPEPIGDVHRIGARYRGNVVDQAPLDVFVEAKYESDIAKRRFMTRGSYRNVDDLQGLCRAEWGVADKKDVIEGNFQMLRKREVRKEFYAKVITPIYKDQDSFFMSGHYDFEKDYHQIVCSVNSPSSRKLAETDMKFASLSNMAGYLNSTTPFLNVTWLKADFDFHTSGGKTLRYIKGTWPTDSAFFKLQSNYTSQNLNRDLQGTINAEVPLTNRHRANIEYGLKERQLLNTGHANVVYNNKKVLNGRYNCKMEQRAGFEKDIVDISLENEMKPIGIHYVHVKQDLGSAFFDMKHTEVYELRNAKKFNITGELHIRTSETGQDIKIVAIHPNRTVILNSEYDQKDSRSRQRSKLQLAPNAWVGYNFEVGNSTTASNESQNFVIELLYPKRNLSAEGWYYITDDEFNSDIAFKWTLSPELDDKKVLRAAMLWKTEPLAETDKDHQTVLVTIGHPSLEKDVTIKGSMYRGLVDMIKSNLVIDYSQDPDHLVTLDAALRDLSTILGYSNYTLKIYGQHNASDLEVNVDGSAAAKSSYYRTVSNALYKRGYYPVKKGMFLGKLDLNKKEIEYERESPYKSVRFWAIPYGSYPFYGLNATVWDSPDMNNTGFFYIDLEKKFTRMEVNLSEDASQNLQMVGYIPDARSGYLDVWRNYEEIRIIDIASYVRMNHSRLVTGKFHWRPTIQAEIRNKVKTIGESLYNSFSDGIDFWIKNMYTETFESINDIWSTAKVHTKPFLDDVSGLSILEEDINDLRKFMNQSYEANDFYVKTVVNFTLTILDELAIRNHIESLPQIVTELWQAMGDSGKALRKSIIWLIETVKVSYNKALDVISRFFHGESLSYISTILEKGVEKYDKFIKDLHISFVKYVENLWNKFWTMMSNYWRSVLKRIEPHIFKFVHYIESAAWNISKEVFDFIYKRTSELAESPYFNKVSTFTQDLDRLVKDIQANDAITNLRKYSVIAWKFLKEKYFKIVPFGKELNDIITEIWEEVKTLQKLEHLQLILQKYDEICAKLEWISEELQFEKRLHQLWAILRNKIRRYTMTALQTEEMYREGKTKFIFDPESGIIDLEQKLPMSWHAFNETPKYEEIPEYKFLADAQNFFSRTNASLVAHIYSLRTHLDPKTWLPPYTSHSLLIGSRHFMTFDKKFVGLNLKHDVVDGRSKVDQCSYVLAHDFSLGNFTLLLEPSTLNKNGVVISTRKLSLITDKGLLEIDVSSDTIAIQGNNDPKLPQKFGDVTIYRDADVLIVESQKEFVLNCNIQFDLCWFELGGWYFGQTAGILGTMNNEVNDDFMSSKRLISPNEEEFVNSWGLNHCKQNSEKRVIQPSESLQKLCTEFFKTASFSTCSVVLDPSPFYEMCLDMGSNSVSTVLGDNHPAIKGACTAALGYIEACAAMRIPLRIPDQCVHCTLPNGTYVPEGTFTTIDGSEIPLGSDVVFIIEAKPCNANLTNNKNVMTIARELEDELKMAGLLVNRYSVLAFGGRAPFDKPRSIVDHNQVFTTNVNDLKSLFDHIEVANGTNNDVFQAIITASKLIFRPGVPRTFILLPCSKCESRNMQLDYDSMLQFMLEGDINLHILTDQEFEFERTRKLRHFYGMDHEFVYSKRFIAGDTDLRKQIHLSKENLGACIPLALDTNGSVFTSRKLHPNKKYPIKTIANTFARRVASMAISDCQICECTGHNTGVAFMMCSPCTISEPTDEDYDIDNLENEFNNWDWEDDE